MAMWLSRMSTNNGMCNDNDKHVKHQKYKPCMSGIPKCYSFYCPSNAMERDNNLQGNPFYTRRSYDISSIQHTLVTEGLYRRDLISSLVGAGVPHVAIKVIILFIYFTYIRVL